MHAAYDQREKELGAEVTRELERRVVLSVLDRKWREHLYEMDYLQEGIGLRAMAQRDPLVEYQREGYDLFAAMMDGIKEESVGFLFNVEVQQPQASCPSQCCCRASRDGDRVGADPAGGGRARDRRAESPRHLGQGARRTVASHEPAVLRADRRRCCGSAAAQRCVGRRRHLGWGVAQRPAPLRLRPQVQALPRRSAGARDQRLSDGQQLQKSMRITMRRGVGRLTSMKPASANMPAVPTWSSSRITFCVMMG